MISPSDAHHFHSFLLSLATADPLAYEEMSSRCSLALLLLLAVCCFVPHLSTPGDAAPVGISQLAKRAATPTVPRLHVIVSLLFGTRTQMAGPWEYAHELARRSHRVTWMHLAAYKHWLGNETERALLPFIFVWLDVAGWNETEVTARIVPVVSADFFAGFDLIARDVYEVLYLPAYRMLRKLVEDDPPHVMLCAALSMVCHDLADQKGLPFVVDVPNALSTISMTGPFDVPGGFSGYSHEWHTQPMWHRIWNTYFEFPRLAYHMMHLEPRLNKLRETVNVRPINAMYDKWRGHDILFGDNFATEWAVSLPPYMHMLGPHTRPSGKEQDASNIAPELRAFLDDGLQTDVPVVYMALGSICILTPAEQRIIAEAFNTCRAAPAVNTSAVSTTSAPLFRVVWVTNRALHESVLASLPSLVRVEKWAAQIAVLAHPAVRLFLSHCGSSSVHESVAAGLPVLGLPCFGDQPLNAIMLQDKGAALVIDKKVRLSSADLCSKIQTLIFDPQYQTAANRAQMTYHLSRDTDKRGADIIERAALVGTDHLRPYRERAEVPLYIRYNLDVYLLGLLVLAAVVAALYYGVRAIIRALIGIGGQSRGRSSGKGAKAL